MYTCFVFVIYDNSTCAVHFRDKIIQICCIYYEDVEDRCVGEYNICVSIICVLVSISCVREYDMCLG